MSDYGGRNGTPARIGDYMIEGTIGAGGMGTVYKAMQISTHRHVALKVLRESLSRDTTYMERFFHEVRLLALMEHPNMVQMYEGGICKDCAYFSMERIEGNDMKELVDSGRRFTEQEALYCARQMASALGYAWNKEKMIHRDVKPANIMLTKEGTAKLLDFGISKKMVPGSDTFLTTTGIMVGSPTYISPEQARGDRNISFHADIYSLGVSLYHILAGKPPFDGKTAVDVITQHLSEPAPNIRSVRPDISRSFARIIQQMMEKSPEDRPQSWDDLKRQFDKLLKAARDKKRNDNLRALRNIVLTPRTITAAALCLILILLCAVLSLLPEDSTGEARPRSASTAEVAMIIEQESPPADSGLRSAENIPGYEKIKADFLRAFREKCDNYLAAEEYAAGAEYCRRIVQYLPSSFKEGGEYEEEYTNDATLRNMITDELATFEQKLEKRLKGLE